MSRFVTLVIVLVAAPVTIASASDDDRDDDRRYEQSRQRYSDDDVRLSQLPQAVQETIRRETRGAEITEIERDEDDGRVHYEVEYRKGNDRFEMHVASDGRVLMIERD